MNFIIILYLNWKQYLNQLDFMYKGKFKVATFLFPFTFYLLLFSCQKNKSDSYTGLKKNTDFAGTQSCISCHEHEYTLWKGSHHDLAMQVADSTTILGNFTNASFTSKGVNYKFFQKDGHFYVNTEGENGQYNDYKIEYTFGVYPLQQYLIAFPDGRYQCLLAAWDSEQNKWFDLQPDLTIHHEEWLHWTGGSMTWNAMCADCHSTNLQKNFDELTNSYTTSYSIINVSCEACHGPSSTHNAYYENEDQYQGQKPPAMYMGKLVPPDELVQKCARCHSRRSQLTEYFDYQGHFLDHYSPQLPTDPAYELDGQIRDEVYVYGSIMQSKMHHNSISCKDCHDVHSLRLKKTGNSLCLTCHEPKYNTYEHHFHKQNTEASQCINCHMTGRTYMGNDFRRDHSFRVPRPDQSVVYGTPNACTSCHTDKSNQWASDAVIKNYGKERQDHFSDHLLAGYHGDDDAFYRVFSQYKYPEIARATALQQYGNQQLSKEKITTLVPFLKDSSALVRNEAIGALDKYNSNDLSEKIAPLLSDSTRLVRITAAKYFAMRDMQLVKDTAFTKASNEYETYLKLNADFASGQHEIALLHQAKGKLQKAIQAYRKALEIDNYYNLSRLNLALLEYQQGNSKTAETLYLKVIEQEPQYSYPYYMLGLLYNENGDTENSLHYLKLATEKEPVLLRAYYNYALKLQESKDYDASILIIEKALKTFPTNEELLYAKLIGELNSDRKKDALKTCVELLELHPENPTYLKIMNELK